MPSLSPAPVIRQQKVMRIMLLSWDYASSARYEPTH
jgi:hypothetical protein